MAQYPEIFVLRHGQTEWNRAGRHQGRLDSPLTDVGREQAAQQGRLLQKVLNGRSDVRAYCSPQGRAQATARIALDGLPLEPVLDSRLCEIGFGKWEGLTIAEISAGWPELARAHDVDPFEWHFQSPGGEGFEQVCDRARAFLDDLPGPAVIVSHGITARLLRGLWLGGHWDEMAALPGGQGCVFHLADGTHRVLRPAQE